MKYLAFERRTETGTCEIRFPAFPGIHVSAPTMPMALERALDALEDAILQSFTKGGQRPAEDGDSDADGFPLNFTGKRELDEQAYAIPATAYAFAKASFIEQFRASNKTGVQLADELGKPESEVRRMLDPSHPTKIGTLEHALRALGVVMQVTLVKLDALQF